MCQNVSQSPSPSGRGASEHVQQSGLILSISREDLSDRRRVVLLRLSFRPWKQIIEPSLPLKNTWSGTKRFREHRRRTERKDSVTERSVMSVFWVSGSRLHKDLTTSTKIKTHLKGKVSFFNIKILVHIMLKTPTSN